MLSFYRNDQQPDQEIVHIVNTSLVDYWLDCYGSSTSRTWYHVSSHQFQNNHLLTKKVQRNVQMHILSPYGPSI